MALTDERIAEIAGPWAWKNLNTQERRNEFARAIESAACAERDKRIAELESQLEEARIVLKDTGLLLHHFWCDVQLNEYSFAKLNQGMKAIDNAMQKG